MITASSKKIVPIDLAEIERICHALERLRDYSPMIRQLWIQTAGLKQRLEKLHQELRKSETTKQETPQ